MRLFRRRRRRKPDLAALIALAEEARRSATPSMQPYVLERPGGGSTREVIFAAATREQIQAEAERAALNTATPIPATPARPAGPPPRRAVSPFSTRPNPASCPTP